MFRVGLGEWAAMGTALCWGVSSQAHSIVSRMVGPNALILLRIPFQLLVLLLIYAVLEGFVKPDAISWRGVTGILLSSIFGLILADTLFYRSVMLIGPQLAILLESTSSIFAAMLGFILLNERLSMQAMIGVLIICLGVGAVLSSKSGNALLPGQEQPKGRVLIIGVLMSLGAAFFMGCGFISLRVVLLDGISPLWVAILRVSFALVILWTLGLCNGWAKQAVNGIQTNHKVFWILLGSNAFGSVGIWFSSVALARAPAGVASSLIGLQPIVVTIIGAVLYRRFPSFRVVIGTMIAFGGTVLLCMR